MLRPFLKMGSRCTKPSRNRTLNLNTIVYIRQICHLYIYVRQNFHYYYYYEHCCEKAYNETINVNPFHREAKDRYRRKWSFNYPQMRIVDTGVTLIVRDKFVSYGLRQINENRKNFTRPVTFVLIYLYVECYKV